MRIVIAALVSLVLSALAGRLLIPVLRRMKAGQSIREDGPKWHAGKSGTPTMGGLMFILGIGVAVEKGFQGGGDRFRNIPGVPYKALAVIEEATPGHIVFREED